MQVTLNIGENRVCVTDVKYNTVEIIREVESRLGIRGLSIKDGKVVRWVKNPYYDDFAEHSHDSPGHYELVSEAKEDVELLKAAQLVCKALKEQTHICPRLGKE